MTPQAFNALILDPAAKALTSITGQAYLDTPRARCMLMAIAGQESAWTARTQNPGGQAHGFWQCEEQGAVTGVIDGPVMKLLANVAHAYSITPSVAEIFAAIQYHDPLAYALARLALWMDPIALPAVGDIDGAWACYERNWRPGKPSRDRWNTIYPQAAALFK